MKPDSEHRKGKGSTIGFSVLFSIGFLFFSPLGPVDVRGVQDNRFNQLENLDTATEAAYIGVRTYQIIGEAQINQDYEETVRRWSEVKEKSAMELRLLEKLAATGQEQALIDQALTRYELIVRVFENEMIGNLKKTGDIETELVIRGLNDKIEVLVDEFEKTMFLYVKSKIDAVKVGLY
ncbi:MAG: hypothetical protein U9P14_08965 [Gemmatimonadota bacterium]|nr:hypothetical protein [Gemmatimonadota bacterium]